MFFHTVLDFIPGWDYKHYNGNNSYKNANLSSTNKIQLKSHDVDGSVVNGLRQPFLLSFALDKLPG